MSERIEQILRDYPGMKQEMKQLEYEIADFRGITEEEMIESMQFFQPDGERVQTSNIANKTENIALNYKNRMERMNNEWYEYLGKKYVMLAEEVRFLEGAIRALPDKMGEIMTALVIENQSWDDVVSLCYVSRMTIGRYRKRAIEELEKIYEQRDAEQIAYLLS